MYNINGIYKFSDHGYRQMQVFGNDYDYVYYSTNGVTRKKAKIYGTDKRLSDFYLTGKVDKLYFFVYFPDNGRRKTYLSELTEFNGKTDRRYAS